jgi:hypothetical protein
MILLTPIQQCSTYSTELLNWTTNSMYSNECSALHELKSEPQIQTEMEQLVYRHSDSEIPSLPLTQRVNVVWLSGIFRPTIVIVLLWMLLSLRPFHWRTGMRAPIHVLSIGTVHGVRNGFTWVAGHSGWENAHFNMAEWTTIDDKQSTCRQLAGQSHVV